MDAERLTPDRDPGIGVDDVDGHALGWQVRGGERDDEPGAPWMGGVGEVSHRAGEHALAGPQLEPWIGAVGREPVDRAGDGPAATSLVEADVGDAATIRR